MSTVDQKFGVFEMPYLFKDREHVKRVATDPKIKKILFDPLPEKGLRLPRHGKIVSGSLPTTFVLSSSRRI